MCVRVIHTHTHTHILVYIYVYYTHTHTHTHTHSYTCIYICVLHTHTHTHTHTHIYCLPQTDCFVVSQLFSVGRHIGRLKLGLNPVQLCLWLSIIPLSQQANHVRLVIIRHEVVAFVCLHLYLAVYQRAQFVRRALHYASDSHTFLHQIAQPSWGSIYCHIYSVIRRGCMWNGHGDPSSNSGRSYLHFYIYSRSRYEFNYSPSSYD